MNAKKSMLGAALLMALALAGCGGLSSEPSVIATLAPDLSTANPHVSLTLTPQATLPPVTGKVTGALTLGTSGLTLPANQDVMLHIIDAQMQEKTVLGTADAQGSYTFDNVTIQTDNTYFVSTMFEGRAFNSDLVTGDPSTTALNVPLTLYSSTTDPASIQLASVILQLTVSMDGLYAVEIVMVNNQTDKVFSTTDQPKPGQFAAVRMSYPKTAQITGFANGDARYLLDETTYQVIDTQAVFPQERHIVHFRYLMPYDPNGTSLDIPIDYSIAGDVQLLVSPSNLTIDAALGDTPLAAGELLQMGDAQYLPFKSTVKTTASSLFRISVKGALSAAPPATVNTTPATTDGISHDLLMGIFFGGGFTFIVLGTVLFVYDRRRGAYAQPMASFALTKPNAKQSQAHPAAKPAQEDKPAQLNPLLAELAQLDDLHTGNRISEASYQRRRKALKARIAALMGVEE